MRYEILALVTCAFKPFLVRQPRAVFLIQHLAADFTYLETPTDPLPHSDCVQFFAKRQPTLNQTKAACNYSTGSPLCLLTYKEPSCWNKHLIHQAWKHLNLYVLVTFQWPCQWTGHPYLQMPPLAQVFMWEEDPLISLWNFWIQLASSKGILMTVFISYYFIYFSPYYNCFELRSQDVEQNSFSHGS